MLSEKELRRIDIHTLAWMVISSTCAVVIFVVEDIVFLPVFTIGILASLKACLWARQGMQLVKDEMDRLEDEAKKIRDESEISGR